MSLHVEWQDEELPDVLRLLNRALNTLEPRDWPIWASALVDRVEARVRSLDEEAASYTGGDPATS